MAKEFREAFKSKLAERRLRKRYKRRQGEKIQAYRNRLNRVFEKHGREGRYDKAPYKGWPHRTEMEKTISAGRKLFKKYKKKIKSKKL